MKRLLLILLVGLLACEDDPEFDSPLGLRLENASEYAFDNITVASGGPAVDFGTLGKGQTSGYQEFTSIYRFGSIIIQVSGREVSIQPRDYLGETPFTSGRYSYIIDIDDSQDPWRTSLEFRED